jgi:hypothetical protein
MEPMLKIPWHGKWDQCLKYRGMVNGDKCLKYSGFRKLLCATHYYV